MGIVSHLTEFFNEEKVWRYYHSAQRQHVLLKAEASFSTPKGIC